MSRKKVFSKIVKNTLGLLPSKPQNKNSVPISKKFKSRKIVQIFFSFYKGKDGCKVILFNPIHHSLAATGGGRIPPWKFEIVKLYTFPLAWWELCMY